MGDEDRWLAGLDTLQEQTDWLPCLVGLSAVHRGEIAHAAALQELSRLDWSRLMYWLLAHSFRRCFAPSGILLHDQAATRLWRQPNSAAAALVHSSVQAVRRCANDLTLTLTEHIHKRDWKRSACGAELCKDRDFIVVLRAFMIAVWQASCMKRFQRYRLHMHAASLSRVCLRGCAVFSMCCRVTGLYSRISSHLSV